MRSPIEMMIDRACGYDPSNPPPVQKEPDTDEVGKQLVEVAEAAMKWDRNHKKGAKRLREAVKRLKELGW